jgi:hypothetical protein
MPLTSTLWSASCEDLSQWRVVPRSKWSSESLPTGKTGSGFHRRDLVQPDLHAHQRTQLVVFISQLYRPKIWISCKKSCCFTYVHSLYIEWIIWLWGRIDFPWAADWLVAFSSLYVALVSPNFKNLGDLQLVKPSLRYMAWRQAQALWVCAGSDAIYICDPEQAGFRQGTIANTSEWNPINNRDITKRWLMQFEDSNL